LDTKRNRVLFFDIIINILPSMVSFATRKTSIMTRLVLMQGKMRIKKRTQHQKTVMVNDDETIETEAVAPSVINKITRETLQQKEWKRVRKILKRQGINNSFDEDLLPIEMNNKVKKGNGNILHQVLQYDPPLQVLKQIVGLLEREHEDFSFLLEETDEELNKSRLPLHVAIAYGSSFDVIDFLVDCCPISAYYKDKNGQSPLHLACSNNNNNAHATAAQALKKDCFDCELQQEQIISKLISAAPDFLLREDSFRMTPKEIAIRSGCCSDRIVSMLNELTLKQREFVRERMMVISTTVFNSM